MSPSTPIDKILPSLDLSCLSEVQRQYITLRLRGATYQQIANEYHVTPQYVHKVLRKASQSQRYDSNNPESKYNQLTEPQQHCVYKNLALEIKQQRLKLFDIATAVGVPSTKMSYYMYTLNKLPVQVALRIQRLFFPELTTDYLFERFPQSRCSDWNFKCAYPTLKKVMEQKKITITELADFLDISEHKMLSLLASGNLSYHDAMAINAVFFEKHKALTLFSTEQQNTTY